MNKIKYGWREVERTVEDTISSLPTPWHRHVTKLIEDLFDSGWDGHLLQIKEKYGGLRFYTDTTTEQQDNMIRAVENLTTKICYECGKPSTGTTKGWIMFVCDEHKEV